MLGDYLIVARLGGGGMADVFLAHKMSHFGFVRRAVIKRVKRSRPGYKNLQRMLLDEARATAFFDHPNLVSIYDVGEDEQGVYVALEYVEGTDLRWVNSKLRARKEALPFELACYITAEVLRGLHHAHMARDGEGKSLEIVHRDVNPSNVLISHTGHVKLADFGVVHMRDRVQQQTEAGLVKGKYGYLAPEYIAGEQCSPVSDLYGAGIMLFELLSGRECFAGATTYEVMWKIVNRGVPYYRLEREGVPEDLARIVQKATSPVPERRYANSQEMANALETWLMRNSKHATAWVLSVFFQRHSLFSEREDLTPAPLASPHLENTDPTLDDTRARLGQEPSGDTAILEPGDDDIEISRNMELARNIEMTRELAKQAARVTAGETVSPHPSLPEPPPTEDVAPPIRLENELADAARSNEISGPDGLGSLTESSRPPLNPTPAKLIPPAKHGTPTPAKTSFPETADQLPTLPAISRTLTPPPTPDLVIEDPEDVAALRATIETSDAKPLSVAGLAPTADLPPDVPPSFGSAPWSGKLEEFSASDAIERLAESSASGMLEFRCGLIWKRLQLNRGAPIGITSNMGMELIGEHLVKGRLLSRRELDRALHNAERDGSTLTSKLLDLKLIEQDKLEEELGKNLSARISEVLEWRWGTFEFTPEPSEASPIKPKLDLKAVLKRASENRARDAAAAGEPEGRPEGQSESDQSRLKEAFQRARSIVESTGKGRVEQVGTSRTPPPSTKR
jgi:serine/threonine protein kinase